MAALNIFLFFKITFALLEFITIDYYGVNGFVTVLLTGYRGPMRWLVISRLLEKCSWQPDPVLLFRTATAEVPRDVAWSVGPRIETPGTVLTQVQFSVRLRDVSPWFNFQCRLSHGLRKAPVPINICELQHQIQKTLVATPLLGHTKILHTSEDIKLHIIIILVFLAIPK